MGRVALSCGLQRCSNIEVEYRVRTEKNPAYTDTDIM